MKQQAIKVLSPEHGKRVIQYFKGKGVGFRWNLHENEFLQVLRRQDLDYIAVSENYMFGAAKSFLDEGTYEIITLPEETNTMTAKEKPYPKMMMVSYDGINKTMRYVVGKWDDLYLVPYKSMDGCREVDFYEYAEDLPETVKVTREEIAEWKGISLDQLEIE